MKRGELWIVNLEPGLGREIHKKRPALIISNDSINDKTSSIIIIPASSQIPQKIGIEMIPVGETEGLDLKSVLLPVFVKSIDKDRLIEKIGEISKTKLDAVEAALEVVLGFQKKN